MKEGSSPPTGDSDIDFIRAPQALPRQRRASGACVLARILSPSGHCTFAPLEKIFMSHGQGGHGGHEDGRRVVPFWQGEQTHSSMSASQRPAPTPCAALPTTLHCAVYVGATAALVPSRRASL
jgi:hypothetical protein